MATPTLLTKQSFDPALRSLEQEDLGPATPSLDYLAMQPYWEQVRDIMAGLKAVQAGKTNYLPKHPKESDTDYQYRLSNGVLTNIFADIIETLAAKPFDQECHIVDGSANTEFIGEPVMIADPDKPGTQKDSGKRVGGFQENVDGKGSHLHVFAHEVFMEGIKSAVDWIFVDYPKMPTNLTAAQEAKYNVRPYWYRVAALDVLDVQYAMVNGKQELVYCRIVEWKQEKEGFIVKLVKQVREIKRQPLNDPETGMTAYGVPEFKLWQRNELANDTRAEKDKWEVVSTGIYTIGVIPMVPFITGTRCGSSWQFEPPMKTAADLQIELYQQETGLKHVTNLVNYPMLSASGVNLKDEQGNKVEITIGPHTVLCAPPPLDGQGQPGKWEFIGPPSDCLTFSQTRVDKTKEDLRELGRQPLSAQSTNITVVTSSFAATKANSAVIAWALLLKDTLENALALTAKWMKENVEPEVDIYTDFSAGVDDTTFTQVQAMRNGNVKDISRKTLLTEAKRRGILGPQFDEEKNEQELAEEILEDQALLDEAALGDPNQPNKPNGVDAPAGG